jgi:carbonic anhydrase
VFLLAAVLVCGLGTSAAAKAAKPVSVSCKDGGAVAVSTDGHAASGRESNIQFVSSDYLEFDWKSNQKSTTIKADGKSVKVLGVQGNTKFKGQVYKIKELVFHAKSETLVNGNQSPLEVRFVHEPPLVLSALYDQGASNKAIDGLGWGALTNDKQTKAVPNTFTPYKLLPRTVAYYHFLGPLKGSSTLKQPNPWTSQLASLPQLASAGVTKKMCTNSIPWIIMHYHGTVSKSALDAFPKVAKILTTTPKRAKAIKKVALMYDKFYFGAHEDVAYIRSQVFKTAGMPTCKCVTPNAGTVGKNQYKCSDGKAAYCAKTQACYATKAFPKGQWTKGCKTPGSQVLQTCKMMKGVALYPFGTGASASYKINNADACAKKCVAVKAKYGCEYTPKTKKCYVVKGPIVSQKKPKGKWPSYGCLIKTKIVKPPPADKKYELTFVATGCPAKPSTTTWWQTQSTSIVLNDMMAYCKLARDGKANKRQTDFCCGKGKKCKPMCHKQAKWATDTLKQGMTLVANDVLNAKNGAQRLVMQADGNLVMYSAKNKVLWKTDTMQAGNRVTMQADGNLVVYGKDSKPKWDSKTSNFTSKRGPYKLIMQNDGNLVVYGQKAFKDKAVWSSKNKKEKAW